MKAFYLIFLMLSVISTCFAQTYDFAGETDDAWPANVTASNSDLDPTETVRVLNETMEALTTTSGNNTAFFDMDLFASETDYSITWKENYTSARRSGFTLRASGANSQADGAKQGYLFQANSRAGFEDVRIYRSNADGFGTALVSASLTAAGTNTDRWYRATVNADTLIMEYSDNGTDFDIITKTIDDTYSSGTTQYSCGYGQGVGGMFIDDIALSTSDFTVAYPKESGSIYNFSSNVAGAKPDDVTEANGTAVTAFHASEGKTMEAKTISSDNTAIFDMDLIPSSSDYSITWKETYTTARRSGFILRGNNSNSTSSGLKQGYLFQANPTSGDVRIYRSNATGFTPLVTKGLPAPGTNTPRWYKATVSGTTLTLVYSDDGIIFKNGITTSDATYSTGTTQYTIGYGNGVGDSFLDNIEYSGDNEIVVIQNVDAYQIFQRDDSDNADILIEGPYYGDASGGIEARWNGNASWTSMTVNSDSYSGTLSDQPKGQGTLELRFTGTTSVNHSREYVGIGDIFIVAGQSNASGRGNTLNSYSHASLKATQFGNDYLWGNLTDAVDDNANEVDAVSSDAATGSPWPLVATSIMASEGIPVAFVPTPKGGTSILQWQPGTNHSNASTLYGAMNKRIGELGGSAKAILFFQGESDASSSTSQVDYETGLNNFINTANSDFTGLKTMVGQIGESTASGKDAIRAGQINVSHTNANAILGPTTYDIDLTVDNLHFKTDAEITEFARRWYKAIDKAFYGGTNGYGPIVDNIINYNVSQNKIIIPFSDDTSPVISTSSTVTATSFDLTNNGSPVTISGVAINGANVEITPSTPLNTLQSITLTYASDNDAVGAAIFDNDNLPAENFYDVNVQLLYTWTGAVDSDWNTSGNWSSLVVPTSSNEVIIPEVALGNYYPVVDEVAACFDLSINDGAKVTVITGADLSLRDDLWVLGGGELELNDGSVDVGGDFRTLSGCTIDINGGILDIAKDWELNQYGANARGIIDISGGTINVGDDCRFSSSVSGLSGTMTGDFELTVGGDFMNSTYNWTVDGGTVKVTGSYDDIVDVRASGGDLIVHNLIVEGSGKTFIFSSSSSDRGMIVKNDFTFTAGTIETLDGSAHTDKFEIAGSFSMGSNAHFKDAIEDSDDYSVGSFDFDAASTYEYYGTTQNIASTSFGNLIVSTVGTKSIAEADAATVEGNLSITAGTLAIESDAANSGSLIVKGTSLGNITYNRYITGVDKWHLVSAPVVGQDVWDYATSTDNDIAENGVPIQKAITDYDEGTDDWNRPYPSSDPAKDFTSGKGYSTLRASNGTVSFTGTVNTSDVSGISIVRTNYGWNCLGNPYPSAINATTTIHATNTLLNPTNVSNLDPSYAAVYLWDAASGAYVTISNSGATFPSTSNLDEDYIQAGQGFFVRSKTGGGTFDITKTMQSHQSGILMKSGEVAWSGINLKVGAGDKQSSTLVAFNSAMTTGLDVSYDAGMFKSKSGLELYSRLVEDNGVDFAIQCLPNNDIESLSIPVGIDVGEEMFCEFNIEKENFGDLPIYLFDAKENTFTNLNEQSYSTVVSKSGIGRFSLQFTKSGLTGIENLTKNEIRVYSSSNVLNIENPEQESGFVQVFNMLGQELFREKLSGDVFQRVRLNIRSSFVIVNVHTGNANISNKVYISGQ